VGELNRMEVRLIKHKVGMHNGNPSAIYNYEHWDPKWEFIPVTKTQ